MEDQVEMDRKNQLYCNDGRNTIGYLPLTHRLFVAISSIIFIGLSEDWNAYWEMPQ